MSAAKWIHRHGRAMATRFTPIRRGQMHLLPGILVVSLTSYPPRFPTLALTLRSLLSQDVRPDALVLWVSKNDINRLPTAATALRRQGLIVRECDDLKSFKKVVPTLLAYPGAFIVTADDDVFYPRGWLRRFTEEYRRPDEVLCQRARRAVVVDGRFAPYREWERIEQSEAGPAVFPTGVAGVMYPPGSLAPQTINADEFMRLSPNADDVWLYWMAARSGCTHRFVTPVGDFVPWPKSQRVALWRTNHAGSENDRQIQAMISAYGMPITGTGSLNAAP